MGALLAKILQHDNEWPKVAYHLYNNYTYII